VFNPNNPHNEVHCHSCLRRWRVRHPPGFHHRRSGRYFDSLRTLSSNQLCIGLYTRRRDVPGWVPGQRPSQRLASRRHQQLRGQMRPGRRLRRSFQCFLELRSRLHQQPFPILPDGIRSWCCSGRLISRGSCFGHRWLHDAYRYC
jgi:hypothetical protein